MRSFILPAAFAVSLLGASAHAAGPAGLELGHCAFPEAPIVPVGATAMESDLADAGAAIKSFVADMQTALACLDAVEKKLGAGITPEQRATITAIYNNGVDQMNALASSYNEQVRAFRERTTEQ